jgi:hypothetical protein
MTPDLSIMGQIREIVAAGRRSRPTAAARLTPYANKGHHKFRAPRSRVFGA